MFSQEECITLLIQYKRHFWSEDFRPLWIPFYYIYHSDDNFPNWLTTYFDGTLKMLKTFSVSWSCDCKNCYVDWKLSNSTLTWNSTWTNFKKLKLVGVGVGLCFHMSRKKTPSTLQENPIHNNPHLASSRRNDLTCLNFGDCLMSVWKVFGHCLEGVMRVSGRAANSLGTWEPGSHEMYKLKQNVW